MDRGRHGLGAALVLAAFLAVYLGGITMLTMATHGWYPILTDTFCGSLGDFTDGPVPAVCLSFPAYWFQALVHPPYALVGLVLGGAVAGAVAFRHDIRALLGT